MAADALKVSWLRAMAGIVLAFTALLAAPDSQAAKRMPVVGAAFVGAIPASISLGAVVDLTLQIRAAEDATDVNVEVLPQTGVEIVSGSPSWSGALAANQTVDLPLSVRFTASGEYTLGARVTNRLQRGVEVSGASLSIIASDGMASLSTDSHALMKLRKASSPDDLRRLGIGPAPVSLKAGAANESGLFQSAAVAAGTATVSGTVNYLDPEGHAHPVRRALVQITDGVSGTVLTQTATSDTGTYSAVVTANSVKVTVYSQDFDNTRVAVFPKDQPDVRYILESAVTPLGSTPVTISITSGATVRGTPGHPSNDSLSARAFSAYDAMLASWFQATALKGSAMQKAMTNFPNPATGGGVCNTSCYSSSRQQMFILHDDAFDYDVLVHEFFHFTTNRAALRVIDSSRGGSHSGGSAIGQNDGTGHLRTRDEGMKLAWSEGLATFMSMALQQSPADANFGYPTNYLYVGDGKYTDTEDTFFTDDPETMPANQGFGAENSVIALFWDLFDSAQDTDNIVTDRIPGVTAKIIWDLINATLSSCNPCDRVDRFWTGAVNLLGPTSSTIMTVADLFVLNKMAPETTAPPDNASVAGGVAPTFQWTPNGDPSASHRNNKFYLVFSRDNFQHYTLIDVPTPGATSYKPTDAEWQNVQTGGDPAAVYKWLVAAQRNDAPVLPEGWFWYSNQRSIVPRAYSAKITWSPLGADVDFHLANPVGEDIAYYNTQSSFNGVVWGFLDRDCIDDCTEENISVNSAPKPGTYRLFAHYYDDWDKGPASVHAEVFAGGTKVLDTSFTLGATGAQHDIFTFNVPASGKPEIILNNPPSPGIEFGSLPKKKGDEAWTVVPGNKQ